MATMADLSPEQFREAWEFASSHPVAVTILEEQDEVSDHGTINRLLMEAIGDPYDLDLSKQPPSIYRWFDDGDSRIYDRRILEYTAEGQLAVIRHDSRFRETGDPLRPRYLDRRAYMVTTADLATRTITHWPIVSVESVMAGDWHSRYGGIRINLQRSMEETMVVVPEPDGDRQDFLRKAHAANNIKAPLPFVELSFDNRIFCPDGYRHEKLIGKIALDSEPSFFYANPTDLLADVAILEGLIDVNTEPAESSETQLQPVAA
ncbi:MAG TPA: hypothetical protein VLF87_01080 [Patescibacteria group bacterium]|nr:hypothetical protein [Patescibacteria group bacterium]